MDRRPTTQTDPPKIRPHVFIQNTQENGPPELEVGQWCGLSPVSRYIGPGLYILACGRQRNLIFVRADATGEPGRLICSVYPPSGLFAELPMSVASFDKMVVAAVCGKISWLQA